MICLKLLLLVNDLLFLWAPFECKEYRGKERENGHLISILVAPPLLLDFYIIYFYFDC